MMVGAAWVLEYRELRSELNTGQLRLANAQQAEILISESRQINTGLYATRLFTGSLQYPDLRVAQYREILEKIYGL